MRWALWVVVAVFVCPTWSFAQETHKPEEWQKLYQDALAQLHAAQDRKAQLADENSKLTEQVKDLQGQLKQANVRNQAQRVEIDAFDDRVFFLNVEHLFWQAFISANPPIRLRWQEFWDDQYPLDSPDGFFLFDRRWPLSAQS